jgi:predicted DNA-binding protein (UPF0251 family)/predicted Fe-Mo cluster-binding NifX family protein
MPRPVTERILGSAIPNRGFRPSGSAVDKTNELVITFDEAEALRLADLEGLYQQAAALRMGVSRQTFGRIIESARRKTADALINGKRLRIDGGVVAIEEKKDRPVMIAVPTTAKGLLEDHFGRCKGFSIYTIDVENKIHRGHRLKAFMDHRCKSGATAQLAAVGVTVLIVGCIGEGAVHVFGAHGITVIRGASGSVQDAVLAFALGKLNDSGISCQVGCRSQSQVCSA